jgi:hypothetical protein
MGRTPKPDNPNFHIVAAATFAEAGMLQEDKYEADWLSQKLIWCSACAPN